MLVGVSAAERRLELDAHGMRSWPVVGPPRRPILIAGPPRSGSTWLEQVLACAAGAKMIHEPDNETCEPFALRAKRTLGRFPVLGPGDAAPAEYAELWSRALAGRVHRSNPAWLAAKAVLWTAGNDLGHAFDRATRHLSPRLRLVEALASPPSGGGGSQVIVKSVHASLAVEWIAWRFDPKIVIVRRNPLDIVASHLDLGWLDAALDLRFRRIGDTPSPGHGDLPWVPALQRTASPAARVAWQVGLFSWALEAAVERNPDWHVVHHEDLCRDPVQAFRQLYDELGLTWTPAASAHLAASNRPGTGLSTCRVASDLPGRWRQRLGPDQVEEVVDMLSRFPAWSGEASSP
jgi:hypothetical protein